MEIYTDINDLIGSEIGLNIYKNEEENTVIDTEPCKIIGYEFGICKVFGTLIFTLNLEPIEGSDLDSYDYYDKYNGVHIDNVSEFKPKK